uniref:Elicitin n=1 Tax=Globisporangium ultimum (strain ATCC 200006 / CBS 805.95 / DAOM BR144) TaxID=431595 RepID=K3WXU9_GLOUD
MKFFFAIAAALVAVTNAANCDLTKLLPLTTDTNVKACSEATGFTPPILPAKEKWPSLCANSDCQTALSKLKALGLGDCTALGVALESGLITPIETFCKSSTPAPATTAPAAGTPTTTAPAAGTPTTTAPAAGTPSATPSATTVKPAC